MNSETVARVMAALNQNDGRLTVDSAKRAGIGKTTLKRAADAGVLLRTARNRYIAVDAPRREAAYKGAYLGHDGVLSFRGATYFWGLDGVDSLVLEWSVPETVRSESPLIHRRRTFPRLDVVEKNGVIVTTVAQTLLDMGVGGDVDLLERIYESALRKGLVNDLAMREYALAHAGWQGAPTLRAVQARRRPGERPTGSDVETLCLQLYRRAGFSPARQFEVSDPEGMFVGYGDLGFPPKAYVTEVEGIEFHDLAQRQHDYNRRMRIENLGFIVRNFTAEDVKLRARYVVSMTRAGLALARWL